MENNAVTVSIVEDFTAAVDSTKIYTLKEIKDILSTVFKQNTNKKMSGSDNEGNDGEKKKGRAKKQKFDKNGDEKPKRKPSAYNLYIKARVEELKIEDPSSTAIDRMKMAASSWKLLTEDEKTAYKQE